MSSARRIVLAGGALMALALANLTALAADRSAQGWVPVRPDDPKMPNSKSFVYSDEAKPAAPILPPVDDVFGPVEKPSEHPIAKPAPKSEKPQESKKPETTAKPEPGRPFWEEPLVPSPATPSPKPAVEPAPATTTKPDAQTPREEPLPRAIPPKPQAEPNYLPKPEIKPIPAEPRPAVKEPAAAPTVGNPPANNPPSDAGKPAFKPVPTEPMLAPLESPPPAESCGAGCDDRWTLPQFEFLTRDHLTLGGWTDFGTALNSRSALNHYNGPIGFADRDSEVMLNQQCLFLERKVDNHGCGFDWGGRIDLLYGTDARYVECVDGLEANWKQSGLYRMALPQFYLDVAYDNLTLRMGHFYSPLGYEVVPAPGNFFYTHSYAFLFGLPYTDFGMLGTYKLDEELAVRAGFTRGNDRFDDTDSYNALGFLGGVSYATCDKFFTLDFNVTASEDGTPHRPDLPSNNVAIYNVNAKLQLYDNLAYVLDHTYGTSTSPVVGSHAAAWYGISQYLLYDIDECWAFGLRFEWFRDDAGTRVLAEGLPGMPNGMGTFQGNFYELTLGLNWKPNPNLTIRPETRWDWAAASTQSPGGATLFPYGGGTSGDQFIFAIDAIISY